MHLTPLARAGACAALVLLAGCASAPSTEGARHRVLSDDGLSELEVAEGWHSQPNFAPRSVVRLADVMDERYLVVNTFRPSPVEPPTLELLAERLSSALARNLGQARRSEARALTIGGRAAIEHEVLSQRADRPLVYLSTVVQGEHARYHLIGWTRAGADLGELRAAMAGFRESPQPRPVLQRVNLVFKWPAYLRAHSDFALRMNHRGQTFEMQGESEMTVRPLNGRELLVHSEVTRHNFANALAQGEADRQRQDFLAKVLKTSLTELPDYVVNRRGGFVRIEQLAAYQQRVQDSILKNLPGSDPQAPQRVRQMVQQMLSSHALSLHLQESWRELVGGWAGGSYVPGTTYTYTLPYQSSALGSQVFALVMTQRLAGFVPCAPGAAQASCVRLVQTARLAGPDYTRAMGAYVRQKVGTEGQLTGAEVLTTVELVTDPQTLLPYSSRKREVKRVTVSAGGKDGMSEEVKESSATYRYGS